MLICAGFAQGLGPRLPHPARSGVRRLAMEDPGHVDQQTIVRRAGLDVVPVPVDERGLIVGELEAADPDAVVVTPVHQFPTGSVLAADRRTALLAWAERRGAVVIEDDYDAEYRCSEPSIAPKRVTTGSSRSLAALYPPGRIDRPPPGGRKVPSCGRFGGRGRTPTVAS